jgi:hypothetical protein
VPEESDDDEQNRTAHNQNEQGCCDFNQHFNSFLLLSFLAYMPRERQHPFIDETAGRCEEAGADAAIGTALDPVAAADRVHNPSND